MRGAVTMTHSKNSILLLKHCLSVMGTGILNTGKLKLSITLIKSSALKQPHAGGGRYMSSQRTAEFPVMCC